MVLKQCPVKKRPVGSGTPAKKQKKLTTEPIEGTEAGKKDMNQNLMNENEGCESTQLHYQIPEQPFLLWQTSLFQIAPSILASQ